MIVGGLEEAKALRDIDLGRDVISESPGCRRFIGGIGAGRIVGEFSLPVTRVGYGDISDRFVSTRREPTL